MTSFLQPEYSFGANHNGSRMSFLPQTGGMNTATINPTLSGNNANIRGPAPQTDNPFFPRLPTSEVLKCLAGLGVNISKDELLHPENHRETIRRLMEYLVEVCLGVSREELAQPAFAGLNAINYPELHEESIPFLNLLRSVSRMMEICEIHDFSLRDLLSPSAVRLNKQLSGILNFVKFREEKLLLLSELSGNREEYLQAFAQAQEKNEALNNRLHLLREQTKEEGEQILALERDCAAFEAHLTELRREEQSLDAENMALSQRNAELETKIAEALTQSEELQAAQRRLSSQIVSSPEKFRKQIIEVGQTLQQEQKDAKAAEKKCKELAAWQSNLDEAHLEVSAALESIEEVRAEVERQKIIITEVDAHKQHIASQRQTLQELQQNAMQFQRQVQRADEKLAALRKQAALRAQDSQKSIDDLHKQLLDAEAFRLQVKSQVERVEGEASCLEKEIEAAHTTQEQEIVDIKVAYSKLERKVVQHLQALRRTLEGQSAPRSPMNVA